jgi:hypothetical protein
MAALRHFAKDDGRRLPVSDDFLLPFLSPTSPGTRYWDPPPEGPMTDRQRGRVVLQLHQALSLLAQCGVDLKGRKLLDIGTGNGLIPRLMLEFSELGSAVGEDLYLSGEHTTSWQGHDEDQAFREMRDFILRESPGALDYARYQGLSGWESHSLAPARLAYRPQPKKSYRFAKIGAHDLAELEERFDLFYAKCIDHIPDWDGIFRAVAAVAEPGAFALIKHNSFFSYLGPHRYATTNIPWGHLLLTDREYERFAREFHAERADQMIDFYFNGLSHPRTTLSGLLRIAQAHGFTPLVVVNEPIRNLPRMQALIPRVEGFWEMVAGNHPGVAADEVFSGRIHLLLRRVA